MLKAVQHHYAYKHICKNNERKTIEYKLISAKPPQTSRGNKGNVRAATDDKAEFTGLTGEHQGVVQIWIGDISARKMLFIIGERAKVLFTPGLVRYRLFNFEFQNKKLSIYQ